MLFEDVKSSRNLIDDGFLGDLLEGGILMKGLRGRLLQRLPLLALRGQEG